MREIKDKERRGKSIKMSKQREKEERQ